MLTPERLREIRKTHGCLIPRVPGLPSCHEQSSCDCTVQELLAEIDRLRAEINSDNEWIIEAEKVVHQLREKIACLRKLE